MGSVGIVALHRLVTPCLLGLLLTCCSSSTRTMIARADTSSQIVMITPDRFGSKIIVAVNDTLAISRPAEFDEWHVEYSDEVLVPLMSDDQRRRPGKGEWHFRVVAAGQTDLVFKARITSSPDGEPSKSPAPPRFVVTIIAKD